MKKILTLIFVSLSIGCASKTSQDSNNVPKTTQNSHNVKMRALGTVSANSMGTFNANPTSPTTNVSTADLSSVTGTAPWCTIKNIELKQIFLKPDSCESCGHSFLVSDSQHTSANHNFVSDSVIGIDIYADKEDGNGHQYVRMDDVPIFSEDYPYYDTVKEGVFKGGSVKFTLPFGDGSNCSMIIIIDFIDESTDISEEKDLVGYENANELLDDLASGKPVSDEDLGPFLGPQEPYQGNMLHLAIDNLGWRRKGVNFTVEKVVSIIETVAPAMIANGISLHSTDKFGKSPLEYLSRRVLGNLITPGIQFEYVKPIFECLVALTPKKDQERLKKVMKNIYDEASNHYGDLNNPKPGSPNQKALMDYANKFIK